MNAFLAHILLFVFTIGGGALIVGGSKAFFLLRFCKMADDGGRNFEGLAAANRFCTCILEFQQRESTIPFHSRLFAPDRSHIFKTYKKPC